jgi:hypothetical protein
MKFIAINSVVSVRKDEIMAVERSESGLCRVILENTSYDSEFPYETILQMLEIPDIEEKVSDNMSRSEAFHNPRQYFAG